MSDLERETRALLELGRGGDDPTDDAIERNRCALGSRLGVTLVGTSALVGATSKAASASASVGGFIKALVVCSSVVVVGSAAFVAVRAFRAEPQVAVAGVSPARVSAPASPMASPTASPPAGLVEERVAKGETTPINPAPSEPRVVASSLRPTTGRSIQDELELVRAAQKHLHRNEPQAALAVLAEHERLFPTGALSEEREASRVFALCATGNVSAARARAARFIRNSPQSPFVDRVRASCQAPGQPGAP